MDGFILGITGVAALIIILFSRMPIGATMSLVGLIGFAYITTWTSALGLLQTVPYSTFADQAMSVIPLFVLMGALCFAAGMSEDMYYAANAWLGHFRGGLAMATIGACGLFAAISGSSLATVATLGKVAWPEMQRYKYSEMLSTGAIAAGGGLGILLPPSTILIIYGVITEQSIGRLFMAGIVPGLMEIAFYIAVIALVTKFRPELGPPGPRTTMKNRVKSLRGCWEAAVIFLLVIGGIYTGYFTPTEAAGIGAAAALFFTALRRKLTFGIYMDAGKETVATVGMLFIIMMGAKVFGFFLTITQLPFQLSEFVYGLALNRYATLTIVLIVFLLLGTVLDSMATVLLAVPVIFPLIIKLGFDPVWFGIIIVRCTEIGLITPPVGLNVFIIQGLTGTEMGKVFRGIIPFLCADIVHIIVMTIFPQIVLFVPNLMKM